MNVFHMCKVKLYNTFKVFNSLLDLVLLLSVVDVEVLLVLLLRLQFSYKTLVDLGFGIISFLLKKIVSLCEGESFAKLRNLSYIDTCGGFNKLVTVEELKEEGEGSFAWDIFEENFLPILG